MKKLAVIKKYRFVLKSYFTFQLQKVFKLTHGRTEKYTDMVKKYKGFLFL